MRAGKTTAVMVMLMIHSESSSTHSMIVECSGSQKESLFGSINNTKTVGRCGYKYCMLFLIWPSG
jgi:hypothetical protein